MKISKWPLVVFNSSKVRRIGEFILNLRMIVLNMGNAVAFFPTPKPALAAVTTDIDTLEAAEAKAQTRVTGAAAARDLQVNVCFKNLKDLAAYVQTIANAAADGAAATAIIESSGFKVKVNGSKMKAPIEAKHGTDSGSVILVAKSAGKVAVYLWQSSTDGNAWNDLPVTQVAKTVVDGLTPAQKMYFRVRTKTQKDGLSEWSAAVGIIVV